MDDTKLKNYLEVTTNVAVVVVAIVVLSVFAWTFFNHYQKTQIQAGLQRGQKLDQLTVAINNNAAQTLLVAMSTTCHYCSESIPFYNQLIEIQHNTNNPTAIIAVFPNSENEAKEYIRQNKLNITTVAASIDFKSLHVTGTPTIILVDNSGKIRDFWVGKLSKDEEQQVIKAIGMNKA